MLHSSPGWRRPLLVVGLLALALTIMWQAATSHALLAADAIALMEPWRFVDESKPGAPMVSGELASVTASAPAQVAARFNLSSTMQALALHLNDADLGGMPLTQIEELGYCTRLISGPRPYAVTLQINIDPDVTDADTSWQGRLVFTPSYNGAVVQGEWQCWNTLGGKWWATGGPVAVHASIDHPLPLAMLMTHFPKMGINAQYSAVALKAGDGWSEFQGEATPVVIGVEGERINLAFGTAPVPQESSPDNVILLPVLFNEPVPQNNGNDNQVSKEQGKQESKEEKQENKEEKKEEKKEESKEDKKENWRAAELGDFNWADFDWDKVDWEHLDWDAFGWGGERAEAVRAFVEDVKGCKDKGWQEKGFNDARDCMAYYVQAHTPADFNWENVDWGRSRNDRDSGDDNGDDNSDNERNNRSQRDRRSDDND